MLLAAPPSSWKASPMAPVQVAVAAVPTCVVQAAGREYYTQLKKQTGHTEKKEEGGPQGVDQETERLKALVLKKDIEIGDYYSLLGLAEEMFDATTEDVKANYKRISVILHPDKAESPEERVFAEERFQSMKKGYETLIDPIRRKKYDSSLPFDESTPKGTHKEEVFFKVFGPVFKRNARFSVNKPTPTLGDINTPWEEVNKMYDFWFDFKSWRDFSALDKHSLEGADSREERRWMERENKKLRAGKKKEEGARVRGFVESAFKHDPRVKAFKAKQEAEKAAAKAAKNKNKNNKEAEAKAKAEQDAKDAKEQEAKDKAAKKQAKFMKDQLRKARSRFRKLCASNYEALSEEDVEKLCAGLALADLQNFVKMLKGDKVEDAKKEIQAKLSVVDQEQDEASQAKAAELEKSKADAAAAEKAKADANKWSEVELEAMISGQKRFNKNWGKITELVNNVSSRTFKNKDIIAKAEELYAASQK